MKKENILYIIITILLIIISSGVTYYIASNKNNDRNNNETINKDNDTKKEEKITLSNIELNTYLSYVPNAYEFNAYTKNSINVKDVKTLYLASMAMGLNHKSIYSPEEVKSYVLNMYNVTINNFEIYKDTEECIGIYDGFGYSLKENEITTEIYNTSNATTIHYIDDYEASKEELIIYEYAGLYLKDFYTDENDKEVYTLDLKDYHNGYQADIYKICNNSSSCATNYLKENKAKFTKYKHTFKKNDTGYYWYQTEVVK